MITRLKETIIFSDDYPDKLVTFVNQDVASNNIENSLINAQALGHEEVLYFVKNRFVPSSANGNKPPVSFQEKMTKVKAPTLDNLFDVETSSAMHDKQVKKVNRQVLQRFVMAYQAGRPVELVKSAKHEI